MLDFARTHVHPGEPVTAQAWNEIVDGLFEAQQLLKAAGGTATVRITNAGFDASSARVVATHPDQPPVEAIRPIAPGDEFILPKLLAGTYEVRVRAPGFDPFTGALSVAEDSTVSPQPLEVALAAAAPFMPYVLGLTLPEAISKIGSPQLQILDISGQSLPKTGFESEYTDARVLVQYPDRDEVIPPDGGFLVVSAGLVIEPLVAVPNLIGLTFRQAKSRLDALGLKLNVIS